MSVVEPERTIASAPAKSSPGRASSWIAHARARALEPLGVGHRVVAAHQHEDGRPGVLRADLPQCDRERLARTRDPLARGVLADVQQRAELAQRQPLLEAQQEHESLVRRQRAERVAHVGPGDRRIRRPRAGERVVVADLVAARPPAQLVEREVGGRAVQPCPQALGRQLARRPAPCPRERLLTEVLGGRRVPDDAVQPRRDAGRGAEQVLIEGRHIHRDDRRPGNRTVGTAFVTPGDVVRSRSRFPITAGQ